MLTLRSGLKVKVRFGRAGAADDPVVPPVRQPAGIQVEHHMDHFNSSRTLIAEALFGN